MKFQTKKNYIMFIFLKDLYRMFMTFYLVNHQIFKTARNYIKHCFIVIFVPLSDNSENQVFSESELHKRSLVTYTVFGQ